MKFPSYFIAGIKTLRAHIGKNAKFPLGVYMVITERCPNRCVYCNYDKLNAFNGRELGTEEAIDIIGRLQKLGMQKLHLTGGEPLLRDDLPEIINYAKSKGIFVGLSSSGVFIPEKVKGIKNADIVMLGFDGEEGIHDSLRGQGSFSKVIKAMDSLKNNRIKYWTTTVLNKKNINSIDYILGLAEEKDFFANFVMPQYIKDNYKSNLPKEDEIRDIVPQPQDLRKTVRYLIQRKRQGARIGSTFSYLNYLLDWEDYATLFSPKKHKRVKCWAERLYFHIDTQGLMHACGLGSNIVPGVDIKSTDIKDALRRIKKMPNCNSCLAACNIENNLIFSLNLNSVFNWLAKL